MEQLEVRTVRLEPMRVAYASGFGTSPEDEAVEALHSWASAAGLLDQSPPPRFFGHDNPSPAPGSPNYGYDSWMTVGPEVTASGKVNIKQFEGGFYLVTRCVGIPNINRTWKRLVAWHEDSDYKPACHQCLEECLSPPGTPLDEVVMDLYLPVAE